MNFARKHFAALTAILVFIVYLITLAPSVVEIDSGELAAVQTTLGIAHPTGYPLFTMIGYLFSLIPLPLSKVYQLNMLAAVWCSMAIGIFVFTSKFLLDNIDSFNPKILRENLTKNKKNKNDIKKVGILRKSASGGFAHPFGKSKEIIPEEKKILASVSGGLILAFSKTFWLQSTSVEVYSLHIFLISLVTLFLLKGYLYQHHGNEKFFRSPWIFFAVSLALSFSNHMTTILILPGAAYLYFSKYKFSKKSFVQIGFMLLIFIPVLTLLYSYLPVRASQNPAMNWGNPVDLERIIRHVSGKQYQVWLFSSTESAKKQLLYFINELPDEFTIELFIILIGLFAAFKFSRKLFTFLIIIFLSTVLYSINYDINDIDSYFLLAYISLSFFAMLGSFIILREFRYKSYSYKFSIFFISFILLTHIYITYPRVNQRDNYAFKDYTKALINSADKNAIVFSYQWDYFVSPAYYFQLVENYRTDVTIVDKELLRRSWYYHQLQTNHPELFSGMQPEVKNFLTAVAPFERSENFNPAIIENAYQTLMTKLVSTNLEQHSFYIGPELFENEMQRGQFKLPDGYTIVPELFLFKVIKGNEYVPAPDPDFLLRLPEHKDNYVKMMENILGSMLTRRALYEMQFDKIDRAKLYIKKIISDLPDYTLPNGLAEVMSK